MTNRDFDFRGMQEKLHRILGEDFFFEINKFIPKKGPSIDVFENDSTVYVVVEQPGLAPKDGNIKIRIEGNKLQIEGEIPFSYPVKTLIQSERFFGVFKREIDLPYSVQTNGVRAAYKKGLLVITIPKKEEDISENVQIDFEEE